MTTVAFIGLGAMGRPMAANLARAQFSVRAFDVVAAARDSLLALAPQATSCVSAEDAARGADALVLMVVNADQAEAALFGAGALDALAPGASVILMATCAPKRVEDIAARVAAAGRRFIDAPVSGGVAGAQQAGLTIMVGADDAAFAAAEPLLKAMGDKVFRVGDRPGQGAAVKTVNQLLCGVHIAVAAEGLALAEKAGIDGELFLKVLGGSAAGSWMLNNRGPRMAAADPPVASAVDIFVKDLGIVLDAGRAQKAATPLAAAALQMFLAASANGFGAMDDSQVVRVYRALNGQSKDA
ncbi:MAG: oxidoreductase [Rhizobiales bacterium 65-9]|nr:NAD(P)-dependent oxidoreductase [Hyphomicrobiales bacterium]OJY32833.1 MAG: oxidoreductase [Rhizobiales bacterium 65-9]